MCTWAIWALCRASVYSGEDILQLVGIGIQQSWVQVHFGESLVGFITGLSIGGFNWILLNVADYSQLHGRLLSRQIGRCRSRCMPVQILFARPFGMALSWPTSVAVAFISGLQRSSTLLVFWSVLGDLLQLIFLAALILFLHLLSSQFSTW